MAGHGRFRWSGRFTALMAAGSLLATVVAGVVGTPPAGALDESFVFVTSLPGHEIGAGVDHLRHGVVHTTPAPNRHRFTTSSGSSIIVVDVRAEAGELTAGAFWDLREPEYDEAKPGFRITIDGRTCATHGGGMVIDDAAFDDAGQLMRLTMRFAPRCTGEPFARLAGTLAYRSAGPAIARRLTPPSGVVHLALGDSMVVPVGFENTGPSPIALSGLGVNSSRVVSGSGPVIWGSSGGTCPSVVPSGASCALGIYLSAVAVGTAVYEFAVHDSLSANQFDSRYVLFPVGVELTIAVDAIEQPPTTVPPTTAPSTTSPTTVPSSVPSTTVPSTTVPSTTVPSADPPPSSTTSTVPRSVDEPEPTVTIEPGAPIPVEHPPASAAGNARHGYISVGPLRVLDTRDGTNVHRRPMAAHERSRFAVAEAAGIQPSLVAGVALNITVVGATDAGYLSVFPSGGDVPDSSNLNFGPERAVANMVIVGVGDDGAIELLQGPSASEVIVDIVGWYGDAPVGVTAAAQFAVSPERAFDTRREDAPLTGGSTRPVRLGGVAGIPADATAVIVNLTATNVTESTFVTLSPWDEPRPATSSLNVVAGETRPNLAIVRLDPSGRAALFLERGRADLVIDVVGYFAPRDGGTFVPLEPERVIDTRFDEEPVFPDDVLALGVSETFEGRRVVGLVLNVTATDADGSGYLTVFPGDATSPPEVSNVNYDVGAAVPNLVVTRVGDGAVFLANALGTLDVLVDVMGLIVE